MTRAEMEQVRAFISAAIDHLRPDESAGEGFACAALQQADAILDAELAKPEAREWRLTWRGGKSSPSVNRAVIDSMLLSFHKHKSSEDIRDPRIESRTPAGPWEPLEVQE